ncbi:transposase [Alteribacter lacisalsi]|uniref:Transposase n=1 Tax=Alteribacter lacisalsi TaxID=2045244 RepID=A0A2W0HF47_9BACI|nr:transposase [Alteribacter lacisalsi]PYZ95935.1 transposase [Alteribacter lacisalsi]
MPRRAREQSRSGIYHVIWRGANRQELFHDDADRIRFLDITKRFKTKAEISVYAWCLMNNHIHLLVKEGNEPIATTMKRVGVSFVSYYNWKYGTTGHLFQDRFKSEKVESVRYLLTVTRYIHQNPVKAGMVAAPDDWKWSSSSVYFGKGSPLVNALLNREYVLSSFSGKGTAMATKAFREFNEAINNDECLDEAAVRRLTDEEARIQIIERLDSVELAHVKSLPKNERNEAIGRIKGINGMSKMQAARILGISPYIVYRA